MLILKIAWTEFECCYIVINCTVKLKNCKIDTFIEIAVK